MISPGLDRTARRTNLTDAQLNGADTQADLQDTKLGHTVIPEADLTNTR
jgi:uncharacterized protein YjbI with pentapeptide repeats